MKKSPKTSSQSQQPPSPINTRKINALSRAYENLPSSGFSKLVVTFCIFFAVVVIIVSFVLLYFGYDTSDLLQPVLLFLGGELLCLSLTTTLKKEQTKNEILFSQIEKDINDGYLYDANGNIVGREGQMLNSNTNTTTNTGNTTNNYYSVTNTNNSNNSQEPQDDSSFYNTNPDLSEAQGSDEELEEENIEDSQEESEIEETEEEIKEESPKPQPKKRGRPRKNPEPKPESDEIQGYSGEFGSVDDDGRD